MKRARTTLFKALVSILFFIVLAISIRGDVFSGLFADFNLTYFTLSFLLGLLMITISCFKWYVLLNSQGHAIPFTRLMRIYFIGYFYTNLLPSSVGGDLVRSFYSGRHIGSQKEAAVCVFLERFTGVILLLLLAVICPLLSPGLYRSPLVWMPSLAAAGLLLLILVNFFSGSSHRLVEQMGGISLKVIQAVPLPAKLESLLTRLVERCLHAFESFGGRLRSAVGVVTRSPSTAAWVILTTVLFYGLTWLNVLFAFRTFNLDVELHAVIAVVPTIMLLMMVPVSLGNLGLAEGAYVVYFRLMGMDPAASLLMGLFLRFKLIVFGCMGFIAYITFSSRQRLDELRGSNEPGNES